jgi:hypothetical protein
MSVRENPVTLVEKVTSKSKLCVIPTVLWAAEITTEGRVVLTDGVVKDKMLLVAVPKTFEEVAAT